MARLRLNPGSRLAVLWLCFSVLSHFSHVRVFAILWTVACQVPPSVGFSRQEHWSGLPFLSPGDLPDLGKGWIKCTSLHTLQNDLPSILWCKSDCRKHFHLINQFLKGKKIWFWGWSFPLSCHYNNHYPKPISTYISNFPACQVTCRIPYTACYSSSWINAKPRLCFLCKF